MSAEPQILPEESITAANVEAHAAMKKRRYAAYLEKDRNLVKSDPELMESYNDAYNQQKYGPDPLNPLRRPPGDTARVLEHSRARDYGFKDAHEGKPRMRLSVLGSVKSLFRGTPKGGRRRSMRKRSSKRSTGRKRK